MYNNQILHTVRIWYYYEYSTESNEVLLFSYTVSKVSMKMCQARHFDHEHAVAVPLRTPISYQPYPLSRTADLSILRDHIYFVNKTSLRQ